MEFKLTNRFNDQIEIDGKICELNLAYDTILRLFELFGDADYSVSQKLDIAYQMLVVDGPLIDISKKDKLIPFILKEFLDIDLFAKKEQDLEKDYDLEQDAGYIYASFLFDYKMDLFEQQGKLHWIKFNHLLANLSKDSKFKEVIGYRKMKIPKSTKGNEDYRKHVIAMKKAYKLNGKEDPHLQVEKIDRTLDDLAAIFRPKKEG